MAIANLSPMNGEVVGKINVPLRRPRASRYPIRADRVEKRVRELGEAATVIALRNGLERVFITDLLEGRKRSVNGRERLERLASALECAPSYLIGSKAMAARVRQGGGLPLVATVEEGVFRAERAQAELPRVPVQPDPRHRGQQAVYAVASPGLEAIGAPPGSWLLTVDAEAYMRAQGGLRSGQVVVLVLTVPGIRGEEVLVRRVVVFADHTELHPVNGEGAVYRLGRQPVNQRLELRAVVLRAVQELV